MQTIIITGANGNLGSAVTRLFLDKGYRVVASVSKETGIQHEHLHTQHVDLADEQAAAAFVSDSIAKFGPVRGALLLVGGFTAGNIASAPGADIAAQIALNFNTAYFVARPLLLHLATYGYGRVVFIGARPALVAAAGKDLVAYTLSKSLLFKLAELVNEEMKGTNVTASVVVPGTIDTPVNRKVMPEADFSNWVDPGQLAGLLEWIVSDKGGPLRETVLKAYNNS